MRSAARSVAVIVVAAASLGASHAAPQGIGDDEPPSFLPFSYPPDGAHMMGEPKNAPGHVLQTPGITAPLVPPTAQAAPAAPRTHAQLLDDLFHRLASAADGDEATGLATRIQRLWLDSGSDTVDLLMGRVTVAADKGDTNVALQLLDKVVLLEPQWAEGWNKRATIRFLADDDDGAMADIEHVLALEPRHFGALSGMAAILQRHGFKKDALQILRKTAAIYPHNDDLSKMIDTLTPEVEGRPI